MPQSSVFARLGARRPLHLGIFYTLAAAFGWREVTFRLGLTQADFLGNLPWFLVGLGLLAVYTWFRDEDSSTAGLMLAVTFAAGNLVAFAFVAVVSTGSFGPAFVLAAASPLTFLVRLALLCTILGFLVWLGRRIRAPTPATVD